jgi:hypothetical protein
MPDDLDRKCFNIEVGVTIFAKSYGDAVIELERRLHTGLHKDAPYEYPAQDTHQLTVGEMKAKKVRGI